MASFLFAIQSFFSAMPKLTLLFDSETLHHYFKELKLKDEECEKLSRVRNELEAELEELTASLFQVCTLQQLLTQLHCSYNLMLIF